MNTITHPSRILSVTLLVSALALIVPACKPPIAPRGPLPQAYTSNQITDPALHKTGEEINTWGSAQANAKRQPLYSRIEVLPPVPIVQPYGVGVFQEEVRLPVIFTTGLGWAGLKHAEKEAAVALAFRHVSEHLNALETKPPLRATLSVQTPQGMQLSWINQLDKSEKNVHGDD